ncbi:hypothetical protein CERZMDRAFT_86058 [Cercospora zeae-maydis SCOH1-5]|uniref:Zinc finger PHD-type domain-containing protein n=1 Tax=Cercospora zeae-maydis SCOH1-5 TaxID=717836 RepID=A0A6A6FA61_9PEZI|nr:hypothetical protein CERZMDRAFT_86058 [Cercospora zeae-maydis SCOH1-5]
MPIVGDLAVQLQDYKGQAVRTFPDLDVEPPARPNTVSRLILETPGEPFQLAISSRTCDSRWVQVLVGGRVVFEKRKVSYGAIDNRRVFRVVEGLQHRGRPDNIGPSRSQPSVTGERAAHIVVEFAAISENDNTEENLRCIFKPRSLSELHDLFPQADPHDLTSPSPSIANQPQPCTEPPSPPTLFTTTTRLYASQLGEHQVEILPCCSLNLYGAAPDPRTGKIAHTGIINCDNEWCQAPGQAWHKSCAGLEISENPKELWICPSCRTMPWEQIEILGGGLDGGDRSESLV